MKNKKIILASTSPRRQELMEKLGIPFETHRNDYEEDMTRELSPIKLAKELSYGKALAVATKNNNALVIGADTFVAHDGKILGKPKDAIDAKRMLQAISGNYVSVITGYTLIDTSNQKSISEAVEAKVWLRKISDREIDEYIATGEPLDKAGAFAVQGLGSIFIEKIDGDFYTVVGLPLNSLVQVLPSFGIDIWNIRKKTSKN